MANSDRISLESKAMKIAKQHGKNLEIINFIDEMVNAARINQIGKINNSNVCLVH